MARSSADEHYEEKFEFPLWKLIKRRAEEKDISYLAASKEVVPEYIKTIRYWDTEFEDAVAQKREEEFAQAVARADEGRTSRG